MPKTKEKYEGSAPGVSSPALILSRIPLFPWLNSQLKLAGLA